MLIWNDCDFGLHTDMACIRIFFGFFGNLLIQTGIGQCNEKLASTTNQYLQTLSRGIKTWNLSKNWLNVDSEIHYFLKKSYLFLQILKACCD